MSGRKRSFCNSRVNTPRQSLSTAHESDPDPPSQLIPLDYEVFNRSRTPPAELAEADSSLWPVKGIVSEEVDLLGKSIYQVEWEGWKRFDGTNTTWEKVVAGPNTIVRTWKGIQTKKRRQHASETPEINLEVIGSFKPHNVLTAERACAFEEKVNLWTAVDFDEWDRELTRLDCDSVPRRRVQRRRREQSEQSTLPIESVNGMDVDGDDAVAASGQSSSVKETIWDVESKWNAAALTAGAASIRIINEIDGYPPVGPDFLYLESSREYLDDIPKPDPGFLVGCDCKDGCRNPILCPCLMESQCIDEDDRPCPAYDKKGHFLFTNRREVVECNANCSCRSCSNNVAQRPRKVPLELFKTRKREWGVRPTVFVPSGTVLGLFTGSVITRDTMADLGSEEKDYCFDLDAHDDDPEFSHAPKYSMSAFSAGNWSRFINHSCGPSAKVYSVVVDTTLQNNMPYIAFVAYQDIQPRQEITIDYNPRGHAIALREQNKGKGKGKMKSSRTPCECGSVMCRGFI